MMHPLKYKICLWKAYFETGYSITNYIKYVIALFGLTTLDLKMTMLFAFIYALFCFIFGYFWFKYKFADAASEVGNQFNPLAKEIRDHINKNGIESNPDRIM